MNEPRGNEPEGSEPGLAAAATKPARRSRQTRRAVVWAELAARSLITIGGVGTIFAVSLIMLFLAWVVLPLFRGASTSEEHVVADVRGDDGPNAPPTAAPLAGSEVVVFDCDDHQLLAWTLDTAGRFELRRCADGQVLARRPVAADAAPTALSFDAETHSLALGFADGSVRLGEIDPASAILAPEEVPEALRGLPPGADAADGERLIVHQLEGTWLALSVDVPLGEPMSTGLGALARLDHARASSGTELCAIDTSGRCAMLRIVERENMITGEVTRTLERSELPFQAFAARGTPSALLISSGGSTVFAVWRDGALVRFDTRDLDAPALAEELDLTPAAGVDVTAAAFLLGRTTLLVGDSSGRLTAWFCVKPEGAGTVDGSRLVQAHELERSGSAVTALASSRRSRTVIAGHADGGVHVFNVTSSKRLAALETRADARLCAVTMAPKEDGLLALGDSACWRWALDLGYPEASLSALFTPVWYEGYPAPEHVWQSSSGTDDFEPKYGLVPLVFGTLKATFYSMLFGVPLALLAAVFSSEFLSSKVRVPVKSMVEIMASLPSVVLGFLAAIIIAPFVQGVLPQTLTAFLTIPTVLLFGARLWQLLPQSLTLRWEGWQRLLFVALCLPVAIALAAWLGPLFERKLFAGDLFAWLAGETGGAEGGWMFLFLPLAAVATAALSSRVVMPLLRSRTRTWTRARCAWLDVALFVLQVAFALFLVWVLAKACTSLGWDTRGGLIGTYVQRNALVVGFVMGFAIIPIIYTIAEDALSSVPGHLRLASLAAGATTWQTAARIIVPTAMSGLFSAVMVGLGRAVGETMIVLMATGNTPVMNWNLFSGFRTLSANIATELPEAVRNSTHYRTLFLAALVLFVMTFAVNTLAEIIRQRFRRRAFQL